MATIESSEEKYVPDNKAKETFGTLLYSFITNTHTDVPSFMRVMHCVQTPQNTNQT
jgi:hypothetical protein